MSSPSLDDQIKKILSSRPPLQVDGSGKVVDYGIDSRIVPVLRTYVKPGSRTVETGSGLSTILFLLLGAHHTAVSPDPGEPERIRTYCKQEGIPVEHYNPCVEKSETILPQLPLEPGYDVALVDGNHAFPAPCIDWFYLTRVLKPSGIMIIDDIQLWTGKIMADFLDEEEVWQTITRNDRFAVYQALRKPDAILGRWWGEQPHVVRQSETSTFQRVKARLIGR